jgi:hypothetical protein
MIEGERALDTATGKPSWTEILQLYEDNARLRARVGELEEALQQLSHDLDVLR